MNNPKNEHPRIPLATYRLQFNREFTFKQASALVSYLDRLGISDIYASPLLTARPGSLHGYDVTDPTKINPEIGSEEDFLTFARHLKEHNMGLIMDVVPNHMCVAGSSNKWWNDVLENGPSSPYAKFFDIDFKPPKASLENKTLLPTLGDQYGRVLENQELKLGYKRGAFTVSYYETQLPLAPRTYSKILERVIPRVRESIGEDHLDLLELESIVTALSHLPPRTETDPEKARERLREKEIIKRRLSALTDRNRQVRAAINQTIEEFNGRKGEPSSFDLLEDLLGAQAYQLSYWRVAADEINYRRFFDINELAAVRVEEPEVFAAVHD
ncbi:MAG TPA: alpha-amylase family glycosyl hydrolase, partial [Blastocatellia bacterium]|nr:alpha-amylase family glycosyl hydrolase [Blastocatellia bacterium]